MHTQELLVEQGSEGQAVKGLHTGIIHSLRVFNFTCGKHMATTQIWYESAFILLD